MNVMLVVTHLLGSGHLSRTLTLGRAFSQAGHDVLVVSGGAPVPQFDTTGLRLSQLPPLHSDGTNFATLLDDQGGPATEALMASRSGTLLRDFAQFQPDILMTELFPFGRRVLRDEFLTLLRAAQQAPRPPLVLSSIRDILAPPSRPSKARWTDETISAFFDGVLVHSDRSTTPLERSWPVSGDLSKKLHYTGYVAPAHPAGDVSPATQGEVLVSAGGGSVGTPLFMAARAAARLTPQFTWRLLIGGQDPAGRIAEIAAQGDSPAILEPARPDFPQMLRHAAASVSLCGYNTALDVLRTGTPAVFVPFDEGTETEQGLRADSLAHLPGIAVLRSAELTPERLAQTVADLQSAPTRPENAICFDGAPRSVALAVAMAEARA